MSQPLRHSDRIWREIRQNDRGNEVFVTPSTRRSTQDELFLWPRLLDSASLIPVIIIFLCLPILAYLCLFYHELDNYLIEKENQDLRGEKRAVEESLKNEITKPQKLEEKLDGTERSCKYHKKGSKDSNVVNFHSLCNFIYGRHNDRIKFYGC